MVDVRWFFLVALGGLMLFVGGFWMVFVGSSGLLKGCSHLLEMTTNPKKRNKDPQASSRWL